MVLVRGALTWIQGGDVERSLSKGRGCKQSTEGRGGAAQVECVPPGNIVIKVMDGRASEGGYLKVVNMQVGSHY